MTSNPLLDFARRLRRGPTLFAAWCSTRDPALTDALLREGFDCAILDWQHGFNDFDSVAAGITAAASAGKAAMVRIGVGDFAEAARFLDWGAAGIIAPMINSANDARDFAGFVKYPPVGARSWGPARAMGMTGLSPIDHLKQANQFTLAIAMIETREALADLDNILAVDGIDGVLVGPSDLSITLSDGATVDAGHPEVLKALKLIAERTLAAGKIAMAFSMDGNRAAEMARFGYHLSSIGTDQLLIRAAARAEIARAKAGVAG